MIVGICKLKLDLSGNSSSKEKSHLLSRIKQKAFSKFKIPVSEVEEHESLEKAVIGFALAGKDENYIRSVFDKMLNFIEESEGIRFLDERMEIIDY